MVQNRLEKSSKNSSLQRALQRIRQKHEDDQKDQKGGTSMATSTNAISESTATFASAIENQASFMTAIGACSSSQIMSNYPLQYSFILDSASTVHIMNDWTRFIDFEEGDGSEFIYTGDTKVMIEGTGTIIVRGRCLDGTEATLTLNNVLYVSTFHTNIVSLTRAIARGIHWNTENSYLTKNWKPLCILTYQYRQWVIKYNPIPNAALAMAAKAKQIMPTSKASARRWHEQTGHPSMEVIKHLPKVADGVEIVDNNDDNQEQCEVCHLTTAKQQRSLRLML